LLFYPIFVCFVSLKLLSLKCFMSIAIQALKIQTPILHTYTQAAVITVSRLVAWTVVRACGVDTGGIDGAVMWTIGTFIHVLKLERSVWQNSIYASPVYWVLKFTAKRVSSCVCHQLAFKNLVQLQQLKGPDDLSPLQFWKFS